MRIRRIGLALAGVALVSGCGGGESRRVTSNAANAGGLMRVLRVALQSYRQKCGGYPPTLAGVLPPEGDAVRDCDRLDVLRPAVRAEDWGDERGAMAERRAREAGEITAARPVSGYAIRYRTGPAFPNGRHSSFEISADPLERGVTGSWSFWVSDASPVRGNRHGPAGLGDPVWGD